MHPFTLTRFSDPGEAISKRCRPAGRRSYVAGGTTLVDLIKLGVMRPDHLVDINPLGLANIEALPDGGLRIGALVRNSDLAWHPDVRTRYPVLAEAILSGASPQVRNMATTAGNILQRTRCPYFRDNISPCNKRETGTGCAALDGFNRGHALLGGSDNCIATHPSDMCVALAALDARVELRGTDGTRTMQLADFHLLPDDTPEREHALNDGELITSVLLPAPLSGARSWYVKARDRDSFAFALASAAVVLQIEEGVIIEARVALGGIATKPWRATAAEKTLCGAAATEHSFSAAAEAALANARPRHHNKFKIPLAKSVLVRALTLASERQPAVRTI